MQITFTGTAAKQLRKAPQDIERRILAACGSICWKGAALMAKHQLIRDGADCPVAVIIPYRDYREHFGSEAIEALEGAEDDGGRIPLEIMQRLANREPPMKIFREWRGHTQAAMAEALGISSGYISQIERGIREPGRKTEAAAAAFLKIDQELLRRELR